MHKTPLATAVAAAFAVSGVVAAGTLEDELAAIKARLNAVEKQVQDQNEVIRQKDRQIAALTQRAGGEGEGGGWFQSVEIGGLLEVEAGYNDPDSGDSSSDVVVATVELLLNAQINDWVAGEVQLLYEEDETDLEVDIATITIADPDGPWFVNGGRQYLPFGTFETHMISDPLTLEIGETRETALMTGIESNGFVGGIYVFNGDLAEDGDNDIDSFGAFAGYGHESGNSNFAVNAGYISNLGDSDVLQDAVNDNLGGADLDDQVAGVALDAWFGVGPFTLIAEYITAVDSFEASELSFDGSGAEPSAFNVEAAYSFTLAGKDVTFAIAYQETDEAVALELPEERIAVGLSVEVMENTTLSFEWAHDDDYSAADGGSGENDGGTFTGQLAVEF